MKTTAVASTISFSFVSLLALALGTLGYACVHALAGTPLATLLF